MPWKKGKKPSPSISPPSFSDPWSSAGPSSRSYEPQSYESTPYGSTSHGSTSYGLTSYDYDSPSYGGSSPRHRSTSRPRSPGTVYSRPSPSSRPPSPMKASSSSSRSLPSKPASRNPYSSKPKDDMWLYSNNVAYTRAQNKISERRILDQHTRFPSPRSTGKSGYPHKYQNTENIFRKGSNSSTSSYYEYPVFPEAKKYYDFEKKKPKMSPGPFRAVTNQNGTYKGAMCHDGFGNEPEKGWFHRCRPDPWY